VPDAEPATVCQLHRPAGSSARTPWSLEITQAGANWSWSSLRVLSLAAGGSHVFETGDDEVLVLPLAGSCMLACGDVEYTLSGRAGVFEGPTDFCYAPPGSTVRVTTQGGGRFAVPGAKARPRLPLRYQPANEVPVEARGAGTCSRRVVNYCMPATFEAERLMVCEVVTPGGNWSSYPPHKHDEELMDETELEEIYYFEVGSSPTGQDGFAFQRVYGTAQRPLDLLAEVRQGDVVLIPHGYHGPSMAAPGYDLYYLNVMAGPGERAWLASDDPAHAWVRGTWADQPVDPRLGSARLGNAGLGNAGLGNAGLGNDGLGNDGLGNAGLGKDGNGGTQ
jgi:5-deoxy-glucuronate isomerase